MAKFEKGTLLSGLGMLYLQMMTEEDTPDTAPVYEEEGYITPSLDKIATDMQIAEKKVYLSNLLHDDISNIQTVTITVDAGYLPTGFEEEATGMIKLGVGSYAMPTNPEKKYFRMGFPITATDGGEVILNFPKCTLKPVNYNAETKREDVNEQIRQFEITGQPLIYRGPDGKTEPFVYYKTDLRIPEAKKEYDRSKLLEKGWYDAATLATAKAETGV